MTIVGSRTTRHNRDTRRVILGIAPGAIASIAASSLIGKIILTSPSWTVGLDRAHCAGSGRSGARPTDERQGRRLC